MIATLIQLVRTIRTAHRRVVTSAVYVVTAALALSSAMFLRYEFAWPPEVARSFPYAILALVVIRLAFSWVFRITTSRWRFVGVHDVVRLVAATVAGSLVFLPVTYLVRPLPVFPVIVLFAEAVLTVWLTAGLWIGYRLSYETVRRRVESSRGGQRRVLIVGAGEAGNMLGREMSRLSTGYTPVGFVDDDRHKWGTGLNGLLVIGSISEVRSIASALKVDEIVIAMPSANADELRRIVQACESTELPCRVLPRIAEVLAGDVRVSQLREVRIEDLLGREPIQLELPELAEDLLGTSVLITGAAGSIGSELARQVARYDPSVLLLMDQAETDLFFLELELLEQHPGLRLVSIVSDIADRGGVERVFRLYRPERVFHAAAYKHVPMMEENAREAVRNNVIGTRTVATAAGRFGAAKFVLVSTDKAVRPASVMGATKRLAEILVLELQEEFPETTFAAVRFGNVLGSNGSVIPIFRRAIQAGQPLTVTHPEITRFFMTIPEAVQLILQASLLPELRGHIAMLEMGEPVRIADLARNLLILSGMTPVPGRNLVFTGLRPGEKLHEELVAPDEVPSETAISKVRIIQQTQGSSSRPLRAHLSDWERALDEGRDEDVVASFRVLFPGLRTDDLDLNATRFAHARRELSTAQGIA